MKKTVLVAGASVGWGHMQAAINVADALSYAREDLLVKAIDIFDYLPQELKQLYEGSWRFASCHLGFIYGNCYRRSMGRTSSQGFINQLVKIALRRMTEFFKHHEVCAYIATQGVAALLGSRLKDIHKYKLCVAATDFVLHSLQVFPNVDFYYLPPACQMAISLKSSDELKGKSSVTGIPIASTFALKKNKEKLRERLMLSPNLITVLFSFGGAGLKAQKHVYLFDKLLNSKLPLQFIVLAGRNERFARMMRAQYDGYKYERRVIVYDYLTDVSDFYAVADIFIGKAGGLTISEALAMHLPIGIIDRLPGQEDFNVEVISSRGLGRLVDNPNDLAEWVRETSVNRGSVTCVADLARPNSSIEVAKHLALIVK